MREFIRKNRNLLIIVGLIIVILALFIYTSTKPSSTETKAPRQAEVEVKIGEEDAQNSLVAYLDPLCDRCHQFTDEVIQDLNENEVKDGKLNITIRPLSIVSQYSSSLNEIAVCADKQGNFLETSLLLGDKIHDKSSDTPAEDRAKKLLGNNPAELIANELDLDQNALKDCLEDNELSSKLSSQDDSARSEDIISTPTIFVNDNEPIRGYSQVGYIRSLFQR